MSFKRREEEWSNNGRGEEKKLRYEERTRQVAFRLDKDVVDDLRDYVANEGKRKESQSYIANEAIKEWLRKRREEIGGKLGL